MIAPRIVLTNNPIPNGNTGVIQKIFQACSDLLFQHSPAHPNINCEIRVTYGTKDLQTRYGGNSVAGYDIDLTAAGNFWCQHLYQFAHEACHVLARYQPDAHCNQWFEESLCEMASIYCLKTLASMGAAGKGPIHGLFSSATPYHVCVTEYADELIHAPARQYHGPVLRKWFEQVEPILRHDSICRPLNNVVANKLLSRFTTTPQNWGAVEFLNAIPCPNDNDSLAEYLSNWKTASPPQHHALIDGIQKMLI